MASTTTTAVSAGGDAECTSLSSSAAIDEVRVRKQVLRNQVRSKLRNMSVVDIQEQSRRVWNRLFALPAYAQAKSVGIFLSMPSGEIDTDSALPQLIGDGKDVYVPRVGLDFEKCDMDLVLASRGVDNDATTGGMFYDDWPRNKWGIPEPPASSAEQQERAAAPGDIDILVVPGVAFDDTGARLGQGKGYYDRFISRMRATASGENASTTDGSEVEEHKSTKPILLVAVGLTPQFLHDEAVPTMEHDFQMDVVLTPETTRIIEKQ